MPDKITLDELNAFLDAIPRPHLHPKGGPGDPVVLTDNELKEYRETGQVFIHYDDGTAAWVFSQENKERLMKRWGIEDA